MLPSPRHAPAITCLVLKLGLWRTHPRRGLALVVWSRAQVCACQRQVELRSVLWLCIVGGVSELPIPAGALQSHLPLTAA